MPGTFFHRMPTEKSRTKPGSYFTYFMYAAPYSLEGSEGFTSFCAHPCVCVQYDAWGSVVYVYVGLFWHALHGGRGRRGGGQEEGGHQYVL